MLDTSVSSSAVRIEAEVLADATAVDALVIAAFGPGRYAKTAERLREQSEIVAGFVARGGERVLGSVRLWSITIGGAPALFLGPIAVAVDDRKVGLGADLVGACLSFAAVSGAGVLLVGDAPYFGRFGFTAAAGVMLPGPADPRRILWRGETRLAGAVLPVG